MRYPVPKMAEHGTTNDDNYVRMAIARALQIPVCADWAMILDEVKSVKFKAEILDEARRMQAALVNSELELDQ